MEREFRLDEKLDIGDTTSHKISGKYLHIKKNVPTWLVAKNEIENHMIQQLKKSSISECMIISQEKFNLSSNQVIYKIKDILKLLNDNLFITKSYAIHVLPPNLQFYLTNECNLRCVHCYRDAGTKGSDELSTNELKRFIRYFSKEIKHETTISFSGGESLLRKDFLDIAQEAKELGNHTYLLTNGTLINKENVKEISHILDKVQLSLDGATEDVNDMIRGKGVFDKVLSSIEMLYDSGQEEVYLSFSLNSLNYENLRDSMDVFLDKIEQYKNHLKIKVGTFIPYGRGNKIDPLENPVEKRKEIANIIESSGFNFIEGRIPTKGIRCTNCLYRNFYVYSNGDVHPCAIDVPVFMQDKVNIRNTPVQDIFSIWRNSNIGSIDKINEYTEGMCDPCDLEYICRGNCRVINMIDNGNIHIPKCSEKHKDEWYKKLIKYSS